MKEAEKKFKCGDCANKYSPLCKLCTRIDSPSGRDRKPSYYVDLTRLEQSTDDVSTEELVGVDIPAAVLMRYLSARAPLPMVVVLEYNRRAEERN